MKLIEWRRGDTPAGGTPNNPADDVGCEIHHTATDDKAGPTGGADNAAELAELCRSIWRYHVKTKGWADIFYGFVVARDGSIASGRGFHMGTSNGHRWITIALAGNYDEIEPTDAQVAAVAAIRAEAANRGVGGKVRGHGDRDQTACPGAGGRWVIQQITEAPAPAPAAPAPAPRFTVELDWRYVRRGDSGALVQIVQAVAAHRHGQANTIGAIDGVYGKRTEAGVVAVQKFWNLDADGIVGPDTLGVLLADWEALA